MCIKNTCSHVIQILDTWDLDKLNLFAKSLSNNPNLSLVRQKNSSSSGDIASSLAHTFHVLQFGLSCLTIQYTVTFHMLDTDSYRKL